jgi:hypothetical protein
MINILFFLIWCFVGVARKKEVEVYVNKEEVKYETRDLM